MSDDIKKLADACTKLQRRLAEEYIIDLNGTQAYKRAGGKAKDAKAAASEILANPNCKKYVTALKNKRSQETKIDAEFVLQKLLASVEADTGEIYNENGGLKPIHEWPPIFRTLLVSSIDVEQQFVYDNGERIPDGYVTKIKLVDKTKLLKMLGDHTDIQAFIKNLNVGVDTGLAKRMEQARKRASNIE